MAKGRREKKRLTLGGVNHPLPLDIVEGVSLEGVAGELELINSSLDLLAGEGHVELELIILKKRERRGNDEKTMRKTMLQEEKKGQREERKKRKKRKKEEKEKEKEKRKRKRKIKREKEENTEEEKGKRKEAYSSGDDEGVGNIKEALHRDANGLSHGGEVSQGNVMELSLIIGNQELANGLGHRSQHCVNRGGPHVFLLWLGEKVLSAGSKKKKNVGYKIPKLLFFFSTSPLPSKGNLRKTGG